MKKHSLMLEITLNVVLLSLALSFSLYFIFDAIKIHLDNQAQSLMQAQMMNISETVLSGQLKQESYYSYNASGQESTENIFYEIQLSAQEEGYLLSLTKDSELLYQWVLMP